MKQCIAYRVSRVHRNAWVRCRRPPVPGQRFCRRHGDGLYGAILGLCMHDYPERPDVPPPESPPRRLR